MENIKMLTQEARAKLKQKEAIKLEQEKKYPKASFLYAVAMVIWDRVQNSKSMKFCKARSKYCNDMAEILDITDDDDDE